MTDKLWFKIGETAAHLGVSPKELRYWETVIPELKPRRSRGNLRYYHVSDFPRLERIRQWLAEGLTVADCRELLLHGQLTRTLGLLDDPATPPEPPARASRGRATPPVHLKPIIKAIKALIQRLERPLPKPPGPKPHLDQTPVST